MNKYKTSKFSVKIEKIEIKRETAKQIILMNNSKVAKQSSYDNYFDTFGEARSSLMQMYQTRSECCKRELEKSLSSYQELFVMKEK